MIRGATLAQLVEQLIRNRSPMQFPETFRYSKVRLSLDLAPLFSFHCLS
jgi:hypothetical protein